MRFFSFNKSASQPFNLNFFLEGTWGRQYLIPNEAIGKYFLSSLQFRWIIIYQFPAWTQALFTHENIIGRILLVNDVNISAFTLEMCRLGRWTSAIVCHKCNHWLINWKYTVSRLNHFLLSNSQTFENIVGN